MSKYVLQEERIQWRDSAMSWQEAIKISAAPLLQEGVIKDSYVDAMITNIKELGPYILIAPKVALPHARPENGVNEAGFSLTVFKDPVIFPAKTNGAGEEANLFICLAAVDSESHLSMLQKISGWLSDEKTLQNLTKASSQEEVSRIVASFQ
ncbi:PTS sugar transporter subunit IIA [Paenalkalicoccus suaedae]|uniref:Ascorbate-specific PTS system EIIA component n=1 Tax=Paenalkalicoccus suaedae TaxID=2592382 RepID=A0A859FIQ7_9BACI|nr:PTS sugar transporter subunit IIA [Paenalkalicoccus suaedae]QKS72674.1 PTS sugar transporter subunit IIA [Paenalkalicoccus suaedae]